MVTKNDDKIAAAEAAVQAATAEAERASQVAQDAGAALVAARAAKRKAEREIREAREAVELQERTEKLTEDWDYLIGAPVGDSAVASVGDQHVEFAILDWGNVFTSVSIPGENLVEFAKAVVARFGK